MLSVSVKPVKILLACCSSFSRLGLLTLLSGGKDFLIVKETTNIDDTLHYAKKKNPDIILFCLALLTEGGNHFIAKMKNKVQKPKIVIFNSSFTQEQELQLLKEGVDGILSSKCSPSILFRALKEVHAGKFWVRRELIRPLIGSNINLDKAKSYLHLTRREADIFSLIGAGYTNQKIASKLCISEATVKTHINNLYKKIGINSRLQATLLAIKHGLPPLS